MYMYAVARVYFDCNECLATFKRFLTSYREYRGIEQSIGLTLSVSIILIYTCTVAMDCSS